MRKDKAVAITLRRSGKSYNEIKEKLGVPKSTLSDWLGRTEWSNTIRNELSRRILKKSTIRLRRLNEIRGKNLKRSYEEARLEAKKEFEYFKSHPLFISGISIYWGEGDKISRYNVRIANVDPDMIYLFVQFLIKICSIEPERIRAWILLYPDLNPVLCKNYWSEKAGLPQDNFNKSIVILGRHKTRKTRYGVCNVGLSSAYLKEKMLVWLSLLSKEVTKIQYYK